MSTSNNLCDFCHLKPKFGNFQYCGRRCSSQATPSAPVSNPGGLCKQCNSKPQFQNFEFCGKNCATIWKTNNPSASSNAGNGLGISASALGQAVPPQLQQLLAKVPPSVIAGISAAVQKHAPPGVAVPLANINNMLPAVSGVQSSNQPTPCIMCLKQPRCSSDRFCSKTCREIALSP